MNRRELLRLAALAGMGGGLAACGIDTEAGVVVDGVGPTGGSGTSGGLSVTPPSQASATTPARAIEAFLAAPAGTAGERLTRVRAFIAPAIAGDWKPSSVNVNVVRHGEIVLKEDTNSNSWRVDLDVIHVGILKDDGTLAPPTAEKKKYTIAVSEEVDNRKGGYYVLEAPKDILLSEGALRQYYEERSLYFWNAANNALVPDLRYVTRAIDDPRRMDTLVTWLTAGPAPWLDGAVIRLPLNSEKIGNVVEKDGKIVVNLKSGAKSVKGVNKLGSQLRWTLREDLGPTELALEIESEPTATVQEQFSDNLAWRAASEAAPECFVIVEGRVQAAGSGLPAPQLSTADNKQIESAAIPRNVRTMIAVVRRDSGGRPRLLLGPRTDLSGGLRDSGIGRSGEMSRPVWLASESVLVTVGGELWQAWRAGSPPPTPVPGQPRGIGAITCVAIGPDARRAALVVGGKLYVAAIVGAERSVTLGAARLIPTSLRDLTAVVFSAEERLVIAGTGDRGLTYIGQVNVDGAQYKPITKDTALGETKVRSMSAHTLSPTDVGPYQVVFGTSQGSFQLAPTPQALTISGQTASASPSPSAKPLLNPFYEG